MGRIVYMRMHVHSRHGWGRSVGSDKQWDNCPFQMLYLYYIGKSKAIICTLFNVTVIVHTLQMFLWKSCFVRRNGSYQAGIAFCDAL